MPNKGKFSGCIFLLWLWACSISAVYASSLAPAKQGTVMKDTASLVVKKIPITVITGLKKNPDYKYIDHSGTERNLWERLMDWFWEKVDALFNNKTGSVTVRIVVYVLSVAAILLMIFLLFKSNTRALFYGKGASVKPGFMDSIENIHEMDFDKQIADEIQKQDFRKAIRLLFLKRMKELSNQNLITWKPDKTNTDYLKELRNSNYHSQFREISRLYEYIWYGDFRVKEPDFMLIIEKFNQFGINSSTDAERK